MKSWRTSKPGLLLVPLLVGGCHYVVGGLTFVDAAEDGGPSVADSGGDAGRADALVSDHSVADALAVDTAAVDVAAADTTPEDAEVSDRTSVDTSRSDLAQEDSTALDAIAGDSSAVDGAQADVCTPDCSGRCGGASDGCTGTCDGCNTGQWCNGQVCEACTTAEHCGGGCDDCTADPTNHACVGETGYHCGCGDPDDCAPGQACAARLCTGNFDQCAAGVDDCDPCTSECFDLTDDGDSAGDWRWRCDCLPGFEVAADSKCALATGTLPIEAAGSPYNLSTDIIDPNRVCPDGVSYSVVEIVGSRATLDREPGLCCLLFDDELLLINLQGSASSSTNVGNWELLRVASVSGRGVFSQSPALRSYGASEGVNSDIGTGEGQQRVMLLRVPKVIHLAIDPGVTLTASPWDGFKGGVFAMRASFNGVQWLIDMTGRGFRGGLGVCGAGASDRAQGGESFAGPGVIAAGDAGLWQTASMANAMGGGGGCFSSSDVLGGGGGGYGAAGDTAVCSGVCDQACAWDAAGGTSLGFEDLTQRMYLGSGGGGGGGQGVGCSNGGAGGGVVVMAGQNIELDGSGAVKADGVPPAPGMAPGGSGSGGSIYLWSQGDVSLGAQQVTARGGEAAAGGAAGGAGRIMLHHTDSVPDPGTTDPPAYIGTL